MKKIQKILFGAIVLVALAIGLYLFEEKSRKFQMDEESSEKGAIERINEDGTPFIEKEKPSGDVTTVVTSTFN